jgi:WD40 repeat protein
LPGNKIDIHPINEWEMYDVNNIAWSIDSSRFAIAGRGNSDNTFGIHAYDVNASDKLWFHETYVPFSLAYSPDNQAIAVPFFAGFDLLDAATGEKVKGTLYQKGVCFGDMAIRFSADGRKVFTLSTSPDDGSTEIFAWDTVENRCLEKLLHEKGVAFDFALSRDEQTLSIGLRDIEVGGHYEQQVHVWDIEVQRLICSFAGTQPAFSPDGDWIAAANLDEKGQIDLWNAKLCQTVHVFPREKQKIPQDMDFNPDGQLLAVGSDTFQIWQVASGRLLFESEQLSHPIDSLLFSPDGRFLLTIIPRTSGDDRAKITLWRISP